MKGRKKKGFSFKPNIEYIKETMDMPAYSKLRWLEEANIFVNTVLSKKEQKIWEKYKRGEV